LYRRFLEERTEPLRNYRPLDAELFGFLTVDTDPRPLPPVPNKRAAPVRSAPVVTPLRDGALIDLGGRSLQVLHTPGHSPDGISLFDDREGLLLTGDAFNLGLVYCHFEDSDLAALRRSAARLAELANDVQLITAHHYPRVIAERSLLGAWSQALQRLDASRGSPSADIFFQSCRLVTDGPFAITLPDRDQPAGVG
jgi:glyoxylase-like metal-dependent hydrolase (beta-lactamase superfamily II)